ncbi:acetyltransferase [Candidatus Pacearchaeota archaeon]|nr:acetyltransferase [Candidatus Pacearchaeota archaeon]
MNKVVIFGTGGFAEMVHFYLTRDNNYKVVAFTANKDHIKQTHLSGLPVISFEEIEREYPPSEYKMFIAVGYAQLNKVRARFYYEAKKRGYELISYISPKATYYDDIKTGDNCFIFENNTIQPFVSIGNDVILWSGNHIGHCASIGDHCFIASHAVISGYVKVGKYCFIGVNASIRDGIEIADECIIGAGALILKSTKEKEVYAGKKADLFPINSSKLKRI